MREEMGDENIFIFGMTEEEVSALKKKGYNPADYYSKNAELRQCIDQIQSGYFTPDQPDTFKDIANTLLYSDRCELALTLYRRHT